MSNRLNLAQIAQLPGTDLDRRFTTANGKDVSLGGLISTAQELSARLPDGSFALNLCQDRLCFTISYLAVMFRNQINLLPQNQSPACIESIRQNYPDSYTIGDDPSSPHPGLYITNANLSRGGSRPFPNFEAHRIASISFTSGSTGQPKTIPKTFGEFMKSAKLATDRLGIGSDLVIVSTVPPQHMYGLETSVFWPLAAPATIHGDRPFFPEDIRRTVSASDKPCLLISTPTHLKACVESNLYWTNLAGVLSSTATLPLKLAESIEHKLRAPLMEVFGSTETLSFATRRLVVSDNWQPYDGIRVVSEGEFCTVQGGHLEKPVRLDDRIQTDHDGRFQVTGRSSDLVKVAGKRASLAELNRLINEIEGVRDGLFYLTEQGRLGALVVSQRSRKSILAELRRSIDEVFLPRPFHRIQEIPRNELGKIVKLELESLIRELDIA